MLCAALDARKREVYIAFYRCNASGLPNRVGEMHAVDPNTLMSMIHEPVLIVGDGVPTYGERWRIEGGDRVELAPVHLHYPSAEVVGLLGGLHLQDNRILDPATAVPFYVRASDAELCLTVKHDKAAGGGE